MPLRLLFAVLALLAAPALAQHNPTDADDVAPVPLPVVKADAPPRLTLSVPNVPGVYTLTIPAAGRPTLSVQPEVIVLDPDGPVVPPGPGPVLSDFAKSIKAAAEKATGDPKRDETAEALGIVYRAVAKDARAAGDKTTPAKMADVNRQMTDAVMARQGAAATAAWQNTRDVLKAKLNAALEEGKSVAQFADIFDEAAVGVESTLPKKSINPDFLAFLKWLIETLLPLLLKSPMALLTL